MNYTFDCAKALYNIGELSESVWIEYLAEEMARQRTEKGINRIRYDILQGS